MRRARRLWPARFAASFRLALDAEIGDEQGFEIVVLADEQGPEEVCN
jgi:hypothetical protein